MKKSKNYSKTVIAGILLGLHFALFFGAIKLTLISNATSGNDYFDMAHKILISCYNKDSNTETQVKFIKRNQH